MTTYLCKIHGDSYRVNEEGIIEHYWEQWSSSMRRIGKSEQFITQQQCIEEFKTIFQCEVEA